MFYACTEAKTGGELQGSGGDLVIPLWMQNKVPEGYEGEDKFDVSIRPAEVTTATITLYPTQILHAFRLNFVVFDFSLFMRYTSFCSRLMKTTRRFQWTSLAWHCCVVWAGSREKALDATNSKFLTLCLAEPYVHCIVCIVLESK